MSKSIKNKIIIPVVTIITLLVVVVTVFVSISVTNLSNDLTYERTNAAYRAAVARLDDIIERAEVISKSVSSNFTLIQSVSMWNTDPENEEVQQQSRRALITYLTEVAHETGADSFIVRDINGTTILRLHDIDNFNDHDGSPAAASALNGTFNSGFSSTATMRMGLNATAPIWHEGEIIGVLAPLFFLHTNQFVDDFAEVFGSEITIFAGPTRVATTLTDDSGQRQIDTDITNQTVIDKVLTQGESHSMELELFGKPHIAYYYPMNNMAGSTIGMFFIGFSNEHTSDVSNALILNMIIIGVIMLAAGVFLVTRIAGGICKPLIFLSDFMGSVGQTGNISISAEDKNRLNTYMQNEDEAGRVIRGVDSFFEHVKKVSSQLETIANGDLSAEIKLLSPSDTMGKSLNKMTDNLSQMFNEINSSTAQVSNGSRQIADSSQALASGSTEQAAAVEELSASVSDISEKTKQNADMAGKAAALAHSIKSKAETGSRQMNEMMSAVNEINQASQSISKVIKVIDDIAFQTNILALNAAVEAARAGQHGKGFAVVAEEVRNLAAKSAEAAKDTGGLIENSIQKAELGAKIAQETSSSLAEIVEGINESNVIVSGIAESSEEQSAGIEQINKGIEQVAQVVQQNSATAQESAAASEEMSGQSSILEELLTQFRLK